MNQALGAVEEGSTPLLTSLAAGLAGSTLKLAALAMGHEKSCRM